jgi:pyruvate/2-oxoglutarate dehydrogenase complex dihydrolipoamide dehydrogenase (E3) component
MFGPIDHNSNMSQPDKFSQKPLRVIVIGAGIVGLSLSHALQLANIDHVVLEKNDKIMSVHGAALVRFCEQPFSCRTANDQCCR